METFKERNYKKEYENYHSKPEQKKRRAGRNHARRQLKDTKGIVGKDVHHKDGNPMNNDKSNLSIVTQKYNRTEPRKRNEEREPQDKDIADKKGTQPAKYFKGLKKSTKSKRDAHFKKGASMSDDNPNAYKEAPGDRDKDGKLKKRRGRPKKFQTLAEVQADINLRELKKTQEKLKREKEREKIIPLKIENTYQLEEFGKKYFKEIFDE